jgi:hypothetical protein
MNEKIPPWGYDEDPWKEMDLFRDWVADKELKSIDVTDTLTLIEVFGLCSETFDSAYPKEAQTEPEDWNEYVQDLG